MTARSTCGKREEKTAKLKLRPPPLSQFGERRKSATETQSTTSKKPMKTGRWDETRHRAKKGENREKNRFLCVSLSHRSENGRFSFSPSFSWSPLFALTDLLFYRFLWTYEEARKKRTIWPMLIFHFPQKKSLRGEKEKSEIPSLPPFPNRCKQERKKVHLTTQICKKKARVKEPSTFPDCARDLGKI